jgi:secondary thiamine-phosphate synthase enzyme
MMSRISIKDERELAVPSRQAMASLEIATGKQGIFDLTPAVEAWVGRHGFRDGVLTLFVRHTSASLTIQENADPDVRADLLDALDRLAPESAPWRHVSEGPDDMPGHVKSALTDTSVAIPVRGGELSLGTWQAIYLIEHRRQVRSRTVQLHYVGS